MISEEAALEQVLSAARPRHARSVDLTNSLGLFAAQDLVARIALPGFDNSAMDGYAVIAGDELRLRVTGEQAAGVDRQLRVSPGEAIRIFTGAPIPAGADAVVMQEDVTRTDDFIELRARAVTGDFLRRRGSDLAEGQKIISRGDKLVSTRVALLASQGFSEVEVGGEVNAAVLSTGDELVAPGRALKKGQLYDSNSFLLRGLLQNSGANVVSVEHCEDEFERLVAAVSRGLESDLLVISGGVSVGEHDLVRRALEKSGASISIWRVAIKPGKPFLFARKGDCCVFGLPGNPVSSFVTFSRFVRPAVLKMLGAADLSAPASQAMLTSDVENDDEKRPHYVRGILAAGKFTPVGRQESHALFGLSRANALLRLEPGGRLRNGATVEVETCQ